MVQQGPMGGARREAHNKSRFGEPTVMSEIGSVYPIASWEWWMDGNEVQL